MKEPSWFEIEVLINNGKDDEMINYIDGRPYLIPRIISCTGCWKGEDPCKTCSGTGRMPIPFSEVW